MSISAVQFVFHVFIDVAPLKQEIRELPQLVGRVFHVFIDVAPLK